jgi:hypothetical protein
MQDVLKPYMDDEEISAYLDILSPEEFDELCRTQSDIRKKYERLNERERQGEVPAYKHVFVEPDWQTCARSAAALILSENVIQSLRTSTVMMTGIRLS